MAFLRSLFWNLEADIMNEVVIWSFMIMIMFIFYWIYWTLFAPIVLIWDDMFRIFWVETNDAITRFLFWWTEQFFNNSSGILSLNPDTADKLVMTLFIAWTVFWVSLMSWIVYKLVVKKIAHYIETRLLSESKNP